MSGSVFERLAPVRRRQRVLHLIRAVALGTLAAAIVGLLVGVARWSGWSDWRLAAGAALAVGLAVAAVAAVRRWPTWESTAGTVDTSCGLKGRVRAALEFVAQGAPTAVHEVQVLDATDALRGIDPRAVVPLRVPRAAPLAAVALAAAVAVLAWPLPAVPAPPPPPEPLPEVLAEAEVMKAGLERLSEEARRQNDPELEKFINDLKAKLENMKRPGVDTREALATLTEVGDALDALRAELAGVDESLREAGSALATAPSPDLKAAGEALQSAQYQKAADALEKGRKNPPAPGEGKATGELLKKVAERMEKKKQERLAQATGQLAASLSSDDKNRFARDCEELAREARQHDARRRLIRLAEEERRRLEECKSRLAAENAARNNRSNPPGSPPNASPNQPSPSASQQPQPGARQQPAKGANQPGQPSGSAPRPGGDLEVVIPTGDGPSNGEIEQGAPGAVPPGGTPARGLLKEALPKARQLAEDEIARDAVPFGYRGLVRNYFMRIQPAEPTPR